MLEQLCVNQANAAVRLVARDVGDINGIYHLESPASAIHIPEQQRAVIPEHPRPAKTDMQTWYAAHHLALHIRQAEVAS